MVKIKNSEIVLFVREAEAINKIFGSMFSQNSDS